MSTNSLASHGMMCVSIKDPHSLSSRQRMEEYLEAIHPKVGLKRREIIVVTTLRMIKPGYFLLTINPNSKLNKIGKGRRYTIITIT